MKGDRLETDQVVARGDARRDRRRQLRSVEVRERERVAASLSEAIESTRVVVDRLSIIAHRPTVRTSDSHTLKLTDVAGWM